jgi:hypothetical protein
VLDLEEESEVSCEVDVDEDGSLAGASTSTLRVTAALIFWLHQSMQNACILKCWVMPFILLDTLRKGTFGDWNRPTAKE